ncbi:hypothetical protein [Amycolatopsis panacis]|uniref:PPE domain-containing protein n=1 Tax=Amycolatopsis panacis TaxID=2340917 RepID=A0A419I1V5_9PSEU|nr:hypothetical protein [Amycolatopsis panacis]RJQ83752.1 hypothetical protein D5S19_19005 [Amycolatopsis panacis]
MSFFDVVGDAAKAVGDALEDAADWAGDLAGDVGHWFGDLYHGNLGDNAVPAPELVAKILASQGAQSWHQGAQQATSMASDHDQAGAWVQQLSAGLESAWSGGGADAAQARIKPFADATTAAAQTYTGNSQNLTDLAHGFDAMKRSLQPMPDAPPHKNFWDEATWWDTDTEDQINQYNKVVKENLDKYHGYIRHAQTSGQTLATDYGRLTAFDSDVTLAEPDTKTTGGPEDGHGPVGHPRSGFGPSHTRGGPSTTFTPNYPGSTPPPPGSSGPLPTYQPPNHPVGPGLGEGTTAAAWTPPDPSRTTGPGSGWIPSSSIPAGGGGNSWSPALIGGFGPIGGSAGGFGPTGGPGGLAGGMGGRAAGGAGVGSGALAGEEAGARGAANAAAARGATGAKGSSGMGGIGAGGGKGKGEEDKEHQRKYVQDDDSAFDITDDEDGRLRDPRTGLPPTPPTIGG